LKFTSSGKLSRSAIRQDFITGEISDVDHLVSQPSATASVPPQPRTNLVAQAGKAFLAP
jgi:hypothetical protein